MIAFIVIFGIICVGIFAYYLRKVNTQEEERRMPGPEEVSIVVESDHDVERGDFYMRDTRKDMNPFERYDIYRVEEVRENALGEKWVRYTAPGYNNDLSPAWKEINSPLKAFLAGKVRVEKVSYADKN